MRFTPLIQYQTSKWLLLCETVKAEPCQCCQKKGHLKRHGRLRGISLTGIEPCIRGLRFYCSNRYSNSGCGRTFTVFFNTVVPHLTVRAKQLSAFFQLLLTGKSSHAAWYSIALPFSLRSAYRWIARLKSNQPTLRSAVYTDLPEAELENMPTHLATVTYLQQRLPSAECFVSAYQQQTQTSFFSASSS